MVHFKNRRNVNSILLRRICSCQVVVHGGGGPSGDLSRRGDLLVGDV